MIKFSSLTIAILSTVALMRGAHADTSEERAEKTVKLMERVADDVDSNKPDCDKIGTALAAHQDEDAAAMSKIKAEDAKLTKQQRDEESKAMKAKYGTRMQEVMKKMAPLKSCKTNAKVKAYASKVLR